jgi:hypothetical protein
LNQISGPAALHRKLTVADAAYFSFSPDNFGCIFSFQMKRISSGKAGNGKQKILGGVHP